MLLFTYINWLMLYFFFSFKIYRGGNSLGAVMAKTSCSQRRGPGFDSQLGNQIPHAAVKNPVCGS